MTVADLIVGRTVREVVLDHFSVTLVLDDGTHYRLRTHDYDGGPIEVQALDARMRVAEVIDRRVAEREERLEAVRRAERAEAERIVRERMERLLSPTAYREWLRRHQPSYIMMRALKSVWTTGSIQEQFFGESLLFPAGRDAA